MVRKIATRKKRLCMLLMVLLNILWFSSVTVFAEENIPDATRQFYINDFANVISDEVEKEMQEKAVSFAESTDGIQVVVTTVKTIGDADPVYYTVDMYNKYGIGKNDMGVLIMLSVETRNIQIRIGDNMTKYLSDRKCGDIRDEGIRYFKNDEFEKGLYEMQKLTIKYISSKVQTANNEVAVPNTDIEDIQDDGGSFLGMLLATLGISSGGVLSVFGVNSHLKKKEKKKAEEERERIENSELVQEKNLRIESLEQELLHANTIIKEKEKQNNSLVLKLDSTQNELKNLKERFKRAIMAYPDLNKKIDAIFAKEKEEADKKKALEVESIIRKALTFECTRHNLYRFSNACNEYRNLSNEQKEYVPDEIVYQVKRLYDESVRLKKKFEEEERIRKNKEKAAEVQSLMLTAMAMGATRHTLYNLRNACQAYDDLTNEQKQYVTANVEDLYEMRRTAKRLQDEYEEEERRRKLREEEERRRRREREEEERRQRESYSTSFDSGSYSGFGGESGGHGAGGDF